MNEEKLKEMAKPNKVGRAREFLQQGGKDEVYGDNEYYRKGFLDGGLYADSHPKIQWIDARTDPPKDLLPVIGYDKGEIFRCLYWPEEKVWSRWTGECPPPEYWMSIPNLPKGGEK